MDIITPKKIQRLIKLAEDKSDSERRVVLSEEEAKKLAAEARARNLIERNDNGQYESSSGILDLDHVEGFGDSGLLENVSTAFNPGEMTGRSTETEEVNRASELLNNVQRLDGRYSIEITPFTGQCENVTNEMIDLMRHSIDSNLTFQSKPNLTQEEASLIAREAPIPLHLTRINFPDSIDNSTTNTSVGGYFQQRCPDFAKMLCKPQSPNRSSFMMPSITEVSSSTQYEDLNKEAYPLITIDDSLDSVPTKQPRPDTQKPEPANPGTGVPKLNPFKEPSRPKEKNEGKCSVKSVNPNPVTHSHIPSSMKPTTSNTSQLLRNLQQSSLRLVPEDTESSENISLSVSKIADYLGRQSNISVSDIMRLQQKKPSKKEPLSELHLNALPNIDEGVTKLIDTKKADTASSAGTVNTVISLDKLNVKDNIPEVIVTRDSNEGMLNDNAQRARRSPSKSPSTLSTVRDNYASFKSSNSPNSSKEMDVANRSKVPSPNIKYKELDKSVDWQEVLQQKLAQSKGVAKEQLAKIETSPVEGFVGVNYSVKVTVTTCVDTWLTAQFKFDEVIKDLNIELPINCPLLLSPGKSEKFVFSLTSKVEMNKTLPFTIYFNNACTDEYIEQKGDLKVCFKIPEIQVKSADGLNKVTYPPIVEKSSVTKSFVIISDCQADLQLKLAVVEGESMFGIKNVQEIKKSEVNKVLLESRGSDDQTSGKSKHKTLSKQLCKLTQENAIKVTMTFMSPKLSELNISSDTKVTLKGMLTINLISGDTVLKKIDLIGSVGTPKLSISAPGDKVTLTNETTTISVTNTGSLVGSWSIKQKSSERGFPFKVWPTKFDLQPEVSATISMTYTGPADCVKEAVLAFEETTTGAVDTLDIIGGSDKSKQFPIKTNHNILSWVREGKKEISLKNSTDNKVYMRCNVSGEGFSIDLPGAESRGIHMLSFEPRECRPLTIVFAPTSLNPCNGTLHLAQDKNSDIARKIKLFGCNSSKAMRWTGLVTYSNEAALVRATARAPVELKLFNKSHMPSFLAARVNFNLQYMSVAATSQLLNATHVVGGRARHTISLRLDWTRVERRARDCNTTALATVTVLTGAEITRRRILKILRDESNGELDTSLLPDNLKILCGHFEGEDASIDNLLKDFNETKVSLHELISGLQELKAHIDIPQEFVDENTIIFVDDTVIDHHTIVD